MPYINAFGKLAHLVAQRDGISYDAAVLKVEQVADQVIGDGDHTDSAAVAVALGFEPSAGILQAGE
ncbi:MAG: hypothetical protein KGJ86_00185 [Chloroflexota bacterium]|nr:hypothetical protein [Chloroflexota bacterium]